MKQVQRRSSFLILALLLTYAGLTFAAPVAPFADKRDGSAAAQPQTEKPVDCKKNPKDPSCKKKQ